MSLSLPPVLRYPSCKPIFCELLRSPCRELICALCIAVSTVDTPDPYVTLRIPHSAEVFAKTTPIRDNKNPVWNETFIFHIDKQAVDRQNILG